MPQVFDRFTQAKQNPDRKEGGLGLGLALVKNLVELHQGSVTAHSEGQGCGARFVIELPLVEARSDRRPQQSATNALATQRVMVVDDNRDAADLWAQLLRRAGHQTQVFYEPTRALQDGEGFEPTVALVDVGLPGMSGYELARRLRQDWSHQVPRLVAVTGYGQPSDVARSESAGFDQHLVKPVTLDILLAAVHPARGETS